MFHPHWRVVPLLGHAEAQELSTRPAVVSDCGLWNCTGAYAAKARDVVAGHQAVLEEIRYSGEGNRGLQSGKGSVGKFQQNVVGVYEN